MTNAQYIIDDRIMSPKVNTLFWRTCYIKQEKYAPITQLPCIYCTTLVKCVGNSKTSTITASFAKTLQYVYYHRLMSNETFPIFAHPYILGTSRSSPRRTSPSNLTKLTKYTPNPTLITHHTPTTNQHSHIPTILNVTVQYTLTPHTGDRFIARRPLPSPRKRRTDRRPRWKIGRSSNLTGVSSLYHAA